MFDLMKKFAAALLAAMMIFSAVPMASSAEFQGEDKIVVVIDPGHGGYDPGTSGGGLVEEKLTLQVALKLKELLEENGNFTVYMTRTTDKYLGIAERGIIANDYNADLLFSIHFDGGTSSSYRGTTYITSIFDEYANVSLGHKVLRELESCAGLPKRGSGVLRRADDAGYYWNAEKQWDCKDPSLGVLSDYYGIPTWGAKFGFTGVIVEHGFLTNAADRSLISSAGTDALAQADANAIIEYYTNHTHSYGASTVDFPSNCMFRGKESEKCTVCGHRRNITYLEEAPDNHYWINETSKNPTCGVDGYISHECRITLNLNEKGIACENHSEKKYYPAEPHDYELTDSKKVTHATDGYSKYTCSKCGDTYTETVKCEGHSWYVTKELKPTCTEKGSKEYACRGCTETKTEALDPLGHKEKLTVDTKPTCTEPGERKGVCTTCKIEINETVDPPGHTFEETVSTPPTCINDGIMRRTCIVCEYSEKRVIDPVGHTPGDDGICTACSAVVAVPEPPETEKTETTAIPDAESVEETTAQDEQGGASKETFIIVVAVAAALFLAVVAIVCIVASRRKKTDDFEAPSEDRDPADEPLETEADLEADEIELPPEEGAEIHEDIEV